MYCPKCKYEYRDGIELCPDCGCKLTEKENDRKKIIDYKSKLCRIYTAADDFEADIIISKLESEGIFAMKKYKSTDGYNKILLGRTILGVEVFVADFDEEEALLVIKS